MKWKNGWIPSTAWLMRPINTFKICRRKVNNSIWTTLSTTEFHESDTQAFMWLRDPHLRLTGPKNQVTKCWVNSCRIKCVKTRMLALYFCLIYSIHWSIWLRFLNEWRKWLKITQSLANNFNLFAKVCVWLSVSWSGVGRFSYIWLILFAWWWPEYCPDRLDEMVPCAEVGDWCYCFSKQQVSIKCHWSTTSTVERNQIILFCSSEIGARPSTTARRTTWTCSIWKRRRRPTWFTITLKHRVS